MLTKRNFASFTVILSMLSTKIHIITCLLIGTDAASKVKAERAAWAWFEETKTSYAFNTILPDLVIGPISNPQPGRYSTASWLTDFFQGDTTGTFVQFASVPSRIVDVRDVAVLHAAALLAPDVNKERLWAASHLVQIDDILKIWREEFPDKKDTLPKDFGPQEAPKQVIDKTRSEELLQRFAGRGWVDLRTSLVDTVKHVA